MAYVTVSTTVDVDLGEIDTDDLIAELESRDECMESNPSGHGPALQAMFQALSLGQEDEALKLLRTYLCDCLGRVMLHRPRLIGERHVRFLCIWYDGIAGQNAGGSQSPPRRSLRT